MALAPGDHTVTGTLSGVEPRSNGWMRFSIQQQGMQYPDKVETAKPEIIAQATALLGQVVTAQVSVVDSGNPNPHRPGTNYMNRYLNAIGPAGQGVQVSPPQQQAPTAAPQNQPAPQAQMPAGYPQQQAHTGQQFDPVRMARMGGSERAVAMVEAGIAQVESIVDLVKLAETWAAYFLLGPERFGIVPYTSIAGMAQQAQQAQPAGDPGPETSGFDYSQAPDDDIPF